MFIFDIAMYKLFINKIHCVLIRFQVYSIGVIKGLFVRFWYSGVISTY